MGDRTIEDLLIKHPRTKEELLDVYGIGNNKIEKYGVDILNGTMTTIDKKGKLVVQVIEEYQDRTEESIFSANMDNNVINSIMEIAVIILFLVLNI